MEIDGVPMARLRDRAETMATVAAAAEAGVFRALAEGPGMPDAIAERAGLDRRATSILLPVLAEAGLLERTADGAYRATAACRAELCDPDHPDYAAGGLSLWLHNLRSWTRLPQVLRTGEKLEAGGTEDDEEGLRRFMAGMAAAPEARIRRIVEACLARNPEASTVLDLGGGPGHMSRAFVDAGLRATLFDTPETVDFVAREYGLADEPHIELVGGDFMEEPLPQGPFDVVLLSNILHIYGPERNRRLLEKVGGVSRPGSVAAVAEFLRGRSDRAARFALVMLMRTEAGNSYGEDAIISWLAAGGFHDAAVENVDEDRQIVTAVRG